MKIPKHVKPGLGLTISFFALAMVFAIIEFAGWYFNVFEQGSPTVTSFKLDPLFIIGARVVVVLLIVAIAVVGILKGYRREKTQWDGDRPPDNELSNAIAEIASLNEELRASNEELFANNEQLLNLNESLTLANQTIARQKDEQLNRVLDSCNDVIWSLDLTSRNESYLSRSAEKVYEEPIEELLKRPRFWMENIVEADRELKEESQHTLEQVGRTECTYRINLPSGIKWIHDRLRLVCDDSGAPVRIEGIASDVTALKESESRIRAERNLLRSIIDNIPDHIFVVDLESRNLIQNRAAYENIGARTEEETLGKTVVDYFGERGKKLIEDNERIFATGIPTINSELQTIAGGQTKTFLYSKVPLYIDGKITGLIGVARDITERVKAKEALNQYRQDLEAVFENSSDRFILVDEQAMMIRFNRRFKEYCETFAGTTPEVGMKYFDVIPETKRNENKLLFNRAIQGETVTTLSSVEKEGAMYYFDVRFNPVVRDGRVTHVTVSGLDITEQKRQEILASHHRENLDIIFQNSTDLFILLNTKLEIVLFNKSFLDYTREFVKVPAYLGMKYLDVISPNRRDIVKELIARCLKGENVKTVAEAVWPSGTYYYNVHYTPVFKDDKVTHITISSTNITEQRKQELIANQYRDNLDILFNNSIDQFELIDSSGKIVLFNKSYETEMEKLFGKRPEIGVHFLTLVPPHRRETALAIFHKALSGETIDHVGEILTPTGKVYFTIKVVPVMKDGKITHVCRTSVDITEKVAQEEKLNKYRENLDIIFKNTDDHFVLIDASGKTLLFNSKFSEFIIQRLGFKPEPGMSYVDLFPIHQKAIAADLFTRALSGESISCEVNVPDTDEYFEIRYIPVVHDGTVTHVSFSAIDMTQRKKQEALINQYRENLSIIFENSTDYFLLLDKSEKVVLFNNKFMECVKGRIGIEPMEGMNFAEVVIPEWKISAQAMVRKALGGESTTSDLSYEVGSEHQFFTARYMPVIQNGTVTHVCYIITDITERVKAKERAEQLDMALQKEKELVEMKSRFVSNASHEFRTPLSTILIAAGFVRKFKHQMQPEDVDRKLNSVEIQVRHMTSLLDDILTLGKSESGNLKVNLTLLDVRQLFDTIVRDLTIIDETGRRINTVYNCGSDTFMLDEGLMRNIVINLLTNAIKFSGDSEVVDVIITCTDSSLDLKIQDYGLGIPPDDMSKLFEPFFRAGNASVVRGTGLGLSIVKRAVERLQGEIDVKSELGKGTAFTIHLPRL